MATATALSAQAKEFKNKKVMKPTFTTHFKVTVCNHFLNEFRQNFNMHN